MVVRIIENECTCFNTKKRVPYRIVVETVEYLILYIKLVLTNLRWSNQNKVKSLQVANKTLNRYKI